MDALLTRNANVLRHIWTANKVYPFSIYIWMSSLSIFDSNIVRAITSCNEIARMRSVKLVVFDTLQSNYSEKRRCREAGFAFL